jgi:hypothetical protein
MMYSFYVSFVVTFFCAFFWRREYSIFMHSKNLWGPSFGANKCGALNDSKKECPLLILVHCILVRFRIC